MTTNKPKSNFVNFTAYNLRAEPVEGTTKVSRFIFSSRNGWPRLTVFYGEKNNSIYAFRCSYYAGIIRRYHQNN